MIELNLGIKKWKIWILNLNFEIQNFEFEIWIQMMFKSYMWILNHDLKIVQTWNLKYMS